MYAESFLHKWDRLSKKEEERIGKQGSVQPARAFGREAGSLQRAGSLGTRDLRISTVSEDLASPVRARVGAWGLLRCAATRASQGPPHRMDWPPHTIR